MNRDEKDPFEWRNGGKKFEVGDQEDGDMSAIVNLGDSLLCVKRKGVYIIRLADEIDPKRTNPNIPDIQQKVLTYGSDEPFVARTLLQADELFKGNFLSKNFNTLKGVNISWSLAKEIASLHEINVAFTKVEGLKNSSFKGKTEADLSLHIPSISNVEQQTKQFIINADHAVKHIMELAQLFYPSISNDKWSLHLYEELKKQNGAKDPATLFVESMQLWVWLIRNLRNAVEHPKQNDKVEISDYKLTEKGIIMSPSIQYNNKDTPLSEIPITKFMTDTVEGIQIRFELLLAYLCNVNTSSAVGDVLRVVEIPMSERQTNKVNVRFEFQIVYPK